MNKVSLLAASVALALTGCGSDNDSPTAPNGISMTAIDGYLQNAEVWVDTNDNLILDTNNDTKLSTTTDLNGKFTLPTEYKDHAVFIKAIKDQTIDSTRGLVTKNFELATAAGSTVVNPMTNMVVDQLAADENLTQEQAEQNVVDSVTGSGLMVSDELIFGDYVAVDTEEAKALNVIGETLVDNSDLSIEKKLELTDAVAEETKKVIDKKESLDDFAPIVKPDGSVTPNSRPVDNQDGSLKAVTLTLGDAWSEIDVSPYFSDINGDALTFTLKELTGKSHDLTIAEGTSIITGLPTAAGDFNYHVFAEDVHGSLSYPLNLKVTVESPNTVPIVDLPAAKSLQDDIDVWSLIEGEQPTASINIASLFTDADGDTLTYRADSTLTVDNGKETRFQVWIDKEGNISFDGPTPRAAKSGVERLYVWAKDGINAEEAVHSFTLPQIEETTSPVEPTPELGFTQAHFDKAGEWKMGSFDYGDAEVAYASMRIIKGVNQFCFATDDGNTDNSLDGKSWKTGLVNLDKKRPVIAESCQPVVLKDDGSLLLEEDSESHIMTMVYQNITANEDYQIIIKMSDGELFWLDSSDTLFASFTLPEAKGGYTEYVLADDDAGHNNMVPLLTTFTYTEMPHTPDESIMRKGTYSAENIVDNEAWTGDWSVIELFPTGSEQYLALPDMDNDNDDMTHRSFTYRHFGAINIGIADLEMSNSKGDNGNFFITSDNKEIMTTIIDAWKTK